MSLALLNGPETDSGESGGRIPPGFGSRTPDEFASDDFWDHVNREMGISAHPAAHRHSTSLAAEAELDLTEALLADDWRAHLAKRAGEIALYRDGPLADVIPIDSRSFFSDIIHLPPSVS